MTKTKLKRLVYTLVYTWLGGIAIAGGVENKTNMSTGYIRNPSRNTECKRPEASFYNIAGTGFMDDGLYFEVGNQFIKKEYSNDWDGIYQPPLVVKGGKSNDETTVLFYPDADIVYKKGHWAVFANFGIYAGGGYLNYSEGTSATAAVFAQTAGIYSMLGHESDARAFALAANDHSLEVTSITYGGQGGLSYNIGNVVSIAAALRYVHGLQDMTLKAHAFALTGRYKSDIKYNAHAYTLSPVLGIHIRPLDRLDIALQYQGWSRLEYTVKDLSGNKEVARAVDVYNEKNFRTDLPAAINFGIGYQILDPLYISTSFDYYFNNFAKQDNVLSTTDYYNSWELGLGIDYQLLKWLGLSTGVSYGHQGTNDHSNSTFNPVLDSVVIGLGAEVNIADSLTVTLAGLHTIYQECDFYLSSYKTKLNKTVDVASIGLTYKLPK